MATFLGVIVQPKTKGPIYALQRRRDSAEVKIVEYTTEDQTYEIIGSGYLETSGGEYAAPAHVTGYPRSHTPHGVTEQGGGYGTCLYTSLVLLAAAESDGEVEVDGLIGSNPGISSGPGRSHSADRWWAAANDRGIAYTVEGEGAEEEVEEELGNEDFDDYVSPRDKSKVYELIQESLGNYDGWYASDITIRVDLTRTTTQETGEITADVYTLDAAIEAKLVAVVDVLVDGGVDDWAAKEEFEGSAYKDVILGMNYVGESPAAVRKFVSIARGLGATEAELEDLMLRVKIDTSTPETAEAQVEAMLATGSFPIESTRQEGVETLPKVSRRVTKADIKRSLARLEKLRTKLGWAGIEDLP